MGLEELAERLLDGLLAVAGLPLDELVERFPRVAPRVDGRLRSKWWGRESAPSDDDQKAYVLSWLLERELEGAFLAEITADDKIIVDDGSVRHAGGGSVEAERTADGKESLTVTIVNTTLRAATVSITSSQKKGSYTATPARVLIPPGLGHRVVISAPHRVCDHCGDPQVTVEARLSSAHGAAVRRTERRVDPTDGLEYTEEEFLDYHGRELGKRLWREVEPPPPPPTPPPPLAKTDALLPPLLLQCVPKEMCTRTSACLTGGRSAVEPDTMQRLREEWLSMETGCTLAKPYDFERFERVVFRKKVRFQLYGHEADEFRSMGVDVPLRSLVETKVDDRALDIRQHIDSRLQSLGAESVTVVDPFVGIGNLMFHLLQLRGGRTRAAAVELDPFVHGFLVQNFRAVSARSPHIDSADLGGQDPADFDLGRRLQFSCGDGMDPPEIVVASVIQTEPCVLVVDPPWGKAWSDEGFDLRKLEFPAAEVVRRWAALLPVAASAGRLYAAIPCPRRTNELSVRALFVGDGSAPPLEICGDPWNVLGSAAAAPALVFGRVNPAVAGGEPSTPHGYPE
eukprot:TRINITY_DN5369_c0_g1_i1.p1 TRINITY_DN5369_c0_g1~~TRINITY_DN5369_c0_g1_i1.p1  ORF type:complete len:583 (+),score=171.09 TRINITY_DN5369_c0_g1_i1:43-1749(+)